MASLHPPHRTFRQCDHCRQLVESGAQTFACSAYGRHAADPPDTAWLRRHTPAAQWQTPAEIAREYSYSEKHVIRLATDAETPIACININGRWFILSCSFAHYVDHHVNGLDLFPE
ncbi:MAG: hypothetical protein ACLFTK_10490 [Anaerolineales bacterium]